MISGSRKEAVMARITKRKTEANRAAIYARVSDKSQDGEDKTSISEQTGDMEAFCESKGLTITARYQEVGRGWSKKRPEFQRMLADARRGRFDTIVCWKSDRLSRGMYPAAALMEVVEAHQIRLRSRLGRHRHEDLRTHGGHRQDRAGQLPGAVHYGQAGDCQAGTGAHRRSLPTVTASETTEGPRWLRSKPRSFRRIFRMYVDEGMRAYSIAVRLTGRGGPHTDRQADVASVPRAPHLGECHLRGPVGLRKVPPCRHRGRHEGLRPAQGHLD